MQFPIGFGSKDAKSAPSAAPERPREAPGRESVALVTFPTCRIPLSYYNDRFELKPGDIVFVEGKYEGVAGRVEKVSTDFKIKIEDYKKVVSVADTRVRGSFRQAGRHLITFDRATLPYRQVLSWFKPVSEDETYINYGGSGFPLDASEPWPFSYEITERGDDYYAEGKVVYLCLDGSKGRAIVSGTRPYEVRFTLTDGHIRDLNCDCPCGYHCKHEAAVLLQLRDALRTIKEKYPDGPRESRYFALVTKSALLSFAVDGQPDVTLTLG